MIATASPLPHGGRLGEARRSFPDAPEPWLDLSTGINPVPYPIPPLPPECLTRLPEPEAVTELERIAASAYGATDPACVAAAPGTQILIDLLPRLWPLAKIAVLGPTYAEHAHAWARSGCRVHHATQATALDGTTSVVVCNPNNPDGARIPSAVLLDLAERIAARNGLLVVDEAFADFDGADISIVPALPHPAILVLRSFGKTYGLAGVRLGFAVADPSRAAMIRAALGPWSVSGPALVAGSAALADPLWREAASSRLKRDGATLDTVLTSTGMTVVGGTCLFRLAHAADAQTIFARLGRAGILVRRFQDRPTLLRFGIPPDAAGLARLRTALGSRG
jgi:cobalamin biosynthetic protein CobC